MGGGGRERSAFEEGEEEVGGFEGGEGVGLGGGEEDPVVGVEGAGGGGWRGGGGEGELAGEDVDGGGVGGGVLGELLAAVESEEDLAGAVGVEERLGDDGVGDDGAEGEEIGVGGLSGGEGGGHGGGLGRVWDGARRVGGSWGGFGGGYQRRSVVLKMGPSVQERA